MLTLRERLSLSLQREVGRLLGPVWIPLVFVLMRLVYRWKIEGVRDTRAEFQRLRTDSSSPLVVCANHLTKVDSFLIAVALGTPGWFLRHYASLPWNTPDQRNFANSWSMRVLIYIMKCIPVQRGGDRRAVGRTLACLTHVLSRGEVGLIFPEGGRSRTARVDTSAQTYGVGRIVKSLPGCRVLCVYLRGEHQDGYSDLPVRGERFRVQIQSFEPKTERRGLRASVEISRQILNRLATMEEQHFDGRE